MFPAPPPSQPLYCRFAPLSTRSFQRWPAGGGHASSHRTPEAQSVAGHGRKHADAAPAASTLPKAKAAGRLAFHRALASDYEFLRHHRRKLEPRKRGPPSVCASDRALLNRTPEAVAACGAARPSADSSRLRIAPARATPDYRLLHRSCQMCPKRHICPELCARIPDLRQTRPCRGVASERSRKRRLMQTAQDLERWPVRSEAPRPRVTEPLRYRATTAPCIKTPEAL